MCMQHNQVGLSRVGHILLGWDNTVSSSIGPGASRSFLEDTRCKCFYLKKIWFCTFGLKSLILCWILAVHSCFYEWLSTLLYICYSPFPSWLFFLVNILLIVSPREREREREWERCEKFRNRVPETWQLRNLSIAVLSCQKPNNGIKQSTDEIF